MCERSVDHDECVSRRKVSLMAVTLQAVLVCGGFCEQYLKLDVQFDMISNRHQVSQNVGGVFII